MAEEDFSDFFDAPGDTEGGSEAFKNKVTNLVREMRRIEQDMSELENQQKRLIMRKRELEEKEIPNALTEAGVSEFTTLEGLKVSTKFIVGTIPADRKDEAFEWLDNHGHGSIIKRGVQVAFDKGSEAAAESAAQAMRAMGLEPKVTLNVHAQTFMSFAREQIQKGTVLPLDKWGVFYGTKAVVK
jgi:hypothetical protein